MNWYIEVLKKYAVFDGRAQRQEYWMFFLFNTIVSAVIGFVFGFIGGMIDMPSLGAASLIYSLGVLVPSIAVAIRRMHDISRSGWWILCPIANIVFLFFDSTPGDNEYGANPKGVNA